MAIITVSREFGSDGTLISQQVAQSLNYLLVDKVLIEKVLRQYGMVHFSRVYDSEHNIWERYDLEKSELIRMLNDTIRAFAKNGNSVILGRGGFAVLGEYLNVLNVCIRAPFEQRVGSIMKSMAISDRKAAENLVNKNDNIRKSFLQTFYNVKHDDTSFYHLVIDSSQIPVEMASRWIIESAEMLDRRELALEQSTLGIAVDPVLTKTVADIIADWKG